MESASALDAEQQQSVKIAKIIASVVRTSAFISPNQANGYLARLGISRKRVKKFLRESRYAAC